MVIVKSVRNKFVLLAALGFGLAAPTAALALPVGYSIQAIDTLAGGTQNFAQDISNTGYVTGNSRKGGAGSSLFPYVWKDGVATEIGLLPGVNVFGRGFAVNDSGLVAGESGNGPNKPFSHSGGGLVDLGVNPGGTGGFAAGVNNSGMIVGSAGNGQASRAFVTNGAPGGPLTDLATPLGTTNSFGRAWAINDSGVIVGVARNATNTASEPARWTPDGLGGYTVATISSPVAGSFGEAMAINATGQIVGHYSDPVSGDTHAFFFDGSVSIDLGLLASDPLFDNARATDINASGLIVGHVADFDNAPSFGGAAVAWEDGEAFDLNDLVLGGDGWTLLSAEGINDHGQIVGFGLFNGQTRAFLLTPVPEPATMLLSAAPLLLMAGAARRGKHRAT